jgi:Zn-dependent peptidase ImmA (M78 family)/transcriptional regulator with XRE-family HTH domain
MTVRVPVETALLTWAQRRSRVSREKLVAKFPALDAWEAGEKAPTLKQLERFARATYTPIGYLLLAEPPEESLPVPDFRTIGNAELGQASPALLDTIYQCQERQNWYREYARSRDESSIDFVGALTIETDIVAAATRMRTALAFERQDRGATWSEAFARLRDTADELGVLVMVNGVVGSNTHRKLDPNEFRGFALVDDLAPLVFVNGADTKAAQNFTLAHELAHIWLGESAVSDADLAKRPTHATERWCNRVAAEFLLPLAELGEVQVDDERLTDELDRVARAFKVSTLVVLRRLFESDRLTQQQFQSAFARERDRVMQLIGERGSGGNFYNTQPVRVSKRFARALIESTLEGQTLHRDAFQMLGFKKYATFEGLAQRLEVGP